MHVIRFSPARFPAPIVRTRAAGEFVLTETRYGAGTALPAHAHEYACLVFVLQGTFAERFESRQRIAEPGMVIVRPEGEPHSDRFDAGGGRCLNIELPPRWLARVRQQARAADRSAAFTGDAFPLLRRRLHEELTHGDDVSPLAVESLLLALFTEGARAERRAGAPAWLSKARERIHARPEARVTLEEIAEEAGVHPVHLAATFRRVFGVTVASYIRRLRIEQACRALRESNAPLADVALAAGFADQSHFGRTFKRLMRMTPSQYRRNP